MSAPEKARTREQLISESAPHVEQMTAEDLAPDGGWGWMVAGGMVIVNLLSIAQGSSFGILYGNFFQDNENGGAALTFINLSFMIAISCSGLVCNELLKTYNIKYVGTFGALIYAIAYILVCFAPNMYYVALSYLIQGFGVGTMMTISNISFNAYFYKLRSKVMGATQVIISLGPIVYPILIERSIAAYGFRATIALLGATSFNAVISMYIMDPVKQHYKMPKMIAQTQVEKEDQMELKLLISKGSFGQMKRLSMDVAENWTKNQSVQSLRAKIDQEKSLLIEATKNPYRSRVSSISGLDIETGFRSRPGKGTSLDLLSSRLSMTAATSVSSMMSTAAVFNQIPEVEVKTADEKRRSILKILADFFEVSLLRDGVYLNMAIGSSITLLSDLLFSQFLPSIMADRGYTIADSALTLTVVAIAELVSKVLFVVFAMFFKVKSRYLYFGAVVFLFLTKVAFLYCNTLMSAIIVNGLSGFARSWYSVPQTLIIAEHFSIERFPAAWGMTTIIFGCTALILFPSIGLLKDWTQSYVITQYALLGGLLMCLIPWTIEYLFVSRKTTETTNRK